MANPTLRLLSRVAAGGLCASLAPWSAVHADYHETLAAAAQGSVEIEQVAGSVEIDGWDRPAVEVTGSPDDLGKRVRMSRSDDTTTIHVEPAGILGSSGGDVHLIVHVPARSTVTTSLVSASLQTRGIQGDAYFRSISGDIRGEVDGNLRVNTVTGTVRMTARAAKRLEVRTVSGNVQIAGGSGEAEVTTVSGAVKADLGSVTRARFKSISADVTANFSMAPNAEIEAESVSGTIVFGFASTPAAQVDVQTFSGSIDNCFGPKPSEAQYGPGSKLLFKSGDGQGSVRIATKSGDVKLCTGLAHAAPAAFVMPPARRWQDLWYVI